MQAAISFVVEIALSKLSNLDVAANAVATYNTSQSANFTLLPASAYVLPASVIIKKGEREATVPITFKTVAFDPTKENVLALKIASVSGGQVVSGNFGTIIFSLPLKSIWEGTYTYTITNDYGTIDANIGGSFTEHDIKLSTVGPNKVRMTGLWQTYSGYSEYQFNADNTNITGVTAFSGSILSSSIQQVVVVDASKQIFEINWTGLGRGARERFVKTGD